MQDKIFSKLNLETMFNEWLDQAIDTDNFEERIGFDLDEAFEEFKQSNDESDPDFTKEWENQKKLSLTKNAQEWFDQRLDEFTYDLETKSITTDAGIVCTRMITVSDKDEFLFFLYNKQTLPGFEGLGVYWAWDHDKAEAHWGEHEHSVTIELKALIPFSAIDQKRTFFLNMDHSLGEDEAEIRVKEGSSVIIFAVDGKILDGGFKMKA